MPKHMPSQSTDRMDHDLGIALLSVYDDDGFLGIQIDAYGEGDSSQPAYEALHTHGFISRPLDPDADGSGCATQYATAGREGFAFLKNDSRLVAKIPRLQKGGSAHYDAIGSYILFNPDDRTIKIHVPFADGQAHTITIGNDDSGARILEFTDGTSHVRLDASGIDLNGVKIDTDGNISTPGSLKADQEITAMAAGPGVKLSTHQHGDGFGGTLAPIPGT